MADLPGDGAFSQSGPRCRQTRHVMYGPFGRNYVDLDAQDPLMCRSDGNSMQAGKGCYHLEYEAPRSRDIDLYPLTDFQSPFLAPHFLLNGRNGHF